jgi:surface protein
MSARQVTKEAAMEKAIMFLHKSEVLNSNLRKSPRKAPQLVLANNRDEFYVFNDEANGGFIIVSGDERMPDVLSYSYDGYYDNERIPCNMQAWMEEYAGQVKFLRTHPEAKVTRRATTQERESISPLLTCKFNQGYPYNNKCPVVDGEHCVTGCVATAMAQIMHYYKWPKQTKDVLPGYKTWKYGIDMPAIPVTTIDWDNILDEYHWGGNYSEEQIDAISTLMLLCGVAINMDYTPSGSSSDSSTALCALRDYFNFDELLEEVNRGNEVNDLGDTSDDWGELLYDELNSGRPVLYSGSSLERSEGHAFVVDGYENGFFHVNWGWGGYYTYVLMTDVEGWESFAYGHFAVVGIQPAYPDIPRMYGVLDKGKMTLFYDNNMATRSGVVMNREEWEKCKEDITECVIDPSFANLKIKMFTEFFSNWSNLKSIEGMEYLNTSMAWNMRYMFSGCSNLTNLDLSNFKTDKVREMTGMFIHCSSLTSLDVSKFQTDDVRLVEYMFYGCSGLTSLDLSNFKTDKVENMFGMFGECSNLTNLNLSNFRTSKVTNMGAMFGWNSRLINLDLSEFKTDNVTDMSRMFVECSNLATIYVSDGWNTEKVENGDLMFNGCYNLVGGASTPFSWEYTGLDYAHVDEGSANPGYLTYKEQTAIQSVKAENSFDYVYSLSGVRLRNSSKDLNGMKQGLFIVNGKKIIVK